MEVLNSKYVKFDGINSPLTDKERKKIPANEILVKVDGLFMPITYLYCVTKEKNGTVKEIKKITSYEEFANNIFNGKVRKPNRDVFNDNSLFVKSVKVPSFFESTSINIKDATEADKIDFGLKRALNVEEAKDAGQYFYAQVAGEWTFVEKDKLYWYEGTEKKTFKDIPAGVDRVSYLSTRQLRDSSDQEISSIYIEQEYNFDSVIDAEYVDFKTGGKYTYQLDDQGRSSTSDVNALNLQMIGYLPIGDRKVNEQINLTVSEQHFVTKQVDDEKKPGKKKEISLIKSTNYKADTNFYIKLRCDGEEIKVKIADLVDTSNNPIANIKEFVGKKVKIVKDGKIVGESEPLTQEEAGRIYVGIGPYMSVTVDGHVRMVKIDNVTDEFGNKVNDMRTMVGKKLNIMEGGIIVATTEPLKYEQANMTYDTIKTYQEVETNPTNNTCLRLNDGSYVNEMKTVQPIAYKQVDVANAEKYLIEQVVGSSVRYVIVDKDYFNKHGNVAGFNKEKSIPLARCDFNSKDCVVIQTTSKKAEIEQCSTIRNIKFPSDSSVLEAQQTKDEAFAGFKAAYEQGQYEVNDVYIDGKKVELAQGGKRYEYTDVSYSPDYASELGQYKNLTCKDITVENGKVKGGAKYDVKKAISNGYRSVFSTLWQGLLISAGVGIFIPFVGPILSAAYTVGVVASIPGIPIVNSIIGAIKNNKFTKYKDKTQHNRKKLNKELDAELEQLMERTDLNELQFNDAYSRIYNKILTLSQTTSNESLQVVDGKVKVNQNNVNLSKEYIKECVALEKSIKKSDKKLKSKQAKFDKIDAKKGKCGSNAVPSSLLKKWNKLKDKLDAETKENKQFKDRKEKLNATVEGQSYGVDAKFDLLKRKATGIKLVTYIKKFPTSDFTKSLSGPLKARVEYSAECGLTIDGYNAFEPVPNGVSGDWEAIQTELLETLDNIENPNMEPPKQAGVEDLSNALNEVEQVYNDCLEKVNTIEETLNNVDSCDLKTDFEDMKNAILIVVNQIYNDSKNKTKAEDVLAELTKIKAKQAELLKLLANVTTLSDTTTEMKTVVAEFDTLATGLESEIAKVLDPTKKDEFKRKLDQLKIEVTKLKQSANAEIHINKMSDHLDKARENLTTAKTMKDEVKSELLNQNKDSLIKRIEEIKTLATTKIAELNGTRIKETSLTLLIANDLAVIDDLKEKAKNTSKVEDAKALKDRAEEILKILNASVDAMKILNAMIEKKSAQAVNYVTEIAQVVSVNANSSLDELKSKTQEANLILDKLKMLVKEAKKAAKQSKEMQNDSAEYSTGINSEDRLVVLLKAREESKDRKKLLDYIVKASGINISHRDIEDTIDRINEKHKEGKSATANATRLKNKNIALILSYGQEYLTKYAETIKQRTSDEN